MEKLIFGTQVDETPMVVVIYNILILLTRILKIKMLFSSLFIHMSTGLKYMLYKKGADTDNG